MARYLYNRTSGDNDPKVVWFKVAASQTIKSGDLVQVDGTSKLLKSAAAASTTIVGVAGADITTGASVGATDRIPVILAESAVIRVDYTGSSKTSLADTDLFTTAFDLSDTKTLNLDDTTGGMCLVLAYNNTDKTADVAIKRANYFLA